MKAVRGAVFNAADAHPQWKINRSFASSVAKRAAGTLTAEWPEVLAARLARRQERARAGLASAHSRRGVVSGLQRRSPLKLVWRELSRMVGGAKRTGNAVRVAALIDALRLVAKAQKSPEA